MSIYKKLFEAKKEIGKISKDSKNPFFKSNYLSLNGLIDAVEPVLQKNELVLLQPIVDSKVMTRIFDITDGSFIESEMTLPNIQDPQKLGSAITYFRRYTLQSLLGLQAEDDDGNHASKPEPKQKPFLNADTKQWTNVVVSIEAGKIKNMKQIEAVYKMSAETKEKLELLIK